MGEARSGGYRLQASACQERELGGCAGGGGGGGMGMGTGVRPFHNKIFFYINVVLNHYNYNR